MSEDYSFTFHYWRKHRREIVLRLRELCASLGIQPVEKGNSMDVLATLAACQTAVTALKAGNQTPTTNFATPDVQSAISSLASSLGVTPVTTPTPATPAAS